MQRKTLNKQKHDGPSRKCTEKLHDINSKKLILSKSKTTAEENNSTQTDSVPR